jgi:hypothetical protein
LDDRRACGGRRHGRHGSHGALDARLAAHMRRLCDPLLLLLLVLLQLASAMGLLRSAQLCFESLALLCIVLGVHGEGDQPAAAIKRTATATLSSSSASASASASASVSAA